MVGYIKYIDSGIPWMPQMPSHWNSLRAKHMYKKENRSVSENDEVITCFRDGTVTLRKNRRLTGFAESLKEFGYQGIRKGDLVIHVMDAFAGSIGVSDSDGKGTPVYSVCTALGDFNNYYYAYILRQMAKKGFIQSLYRGIRERSSDFRFDVFANQVLPVPPRAEQEQIVRFLDWKVSEINNLIGIKRKRILNIRDYEKQVINEKVLHGLHNSNLKYSGNKWIGCIPDNWEIISLGKFCSFQNGISESGDFFTSGTPFVGYGDVYRHIELPVKVNGKAQSNQKQQELFSVQKDDIFFTRTSENLEEIGMAAVCSHTIDKAVFSGFLIRCRQKEKYVIANYMKYYLQIPAVRNHFSSNVNIVIRASLSQNLLKTLPVVIPPENEQRKIASYLDLKHTEFEKVIEITTKEIEELNELKNTLISDVVTGKIDVRNVEIPAYEHVEDIADAGDGEESAEELEGAEETEA